MEYEFHSEMSNYANPQKENLILKIKLFFCLFFLNCTNSTWLGLPVEVNVGFSLDFSGVLASLAL